MLMTLTSDLYLYLDLTGQFIDIHIRAHVSQVMPHPRLHLSYDSSNSGTKVFLVTRGILVDLDL